MIRKLHFVLIVFMLSFVSVSAQFREIYNGGDPNNPVINSNGTIRSLTVKPGASVTVNSGYTLTILKK